MMLQGIATDIALALSTFFQSNILGVNKESRGNKDGAYEQIETAMDEKIVRLRQTLRDTAITKLSSAVFSEDTRKALATIIMDSLREEFIDKDIKMEPEEFLAQVPITLFAQMLWGVGKSHKDILGPLAVNLESDWAKQAAESLVKTVMGFQAKTNAAETEQDGTSSDNKSPGSEEGASPWANS